MDSIDHQTLGVAIAKLYTTKTAVHHDTSIEAAPCEGAAFEIVLVEETIQVAALGDHRVIVTNPGHGRACNIAIHDEHVGLEDVCRNGILT